MKYKEELNKYNAEIARIDGLVELEAGKAWEEVSLDAKKENDNNEKYTKELNEEPCSVCGKSQFVIKYRDVSGKIKGRMSGRFSLFGGSISGYVDGDIHTEPILSCRECENERRIKLADSSLSEDLLVKNYPLYFEWSEDDPASGWLSSKGLEVAIKLEDKFFLVKDHRSPSRHTDERNAGVGLTRKYPLPKRPSRFKCLFSL